MLSTPTLLGLAAARAGSAEGEQRMPVVSAAAYDQRPTALPTSGEDRLLAAVNRVHGCFDPRRGGLDNAHAVLEELIRLTSSSVGFLAEVDSGSGSETAFRILVLGGPGFDEKMCVFLDHETPEWLEFPSSGGVFGAAIQTRQPVICNHFATDPRAWSLPPGHPAVDNFALVPLVIGAETVALAALANAPGGYRRAELATLKPVLDAAAVVVLAALLTTSRAVAADVRDELDQRHWALLDRIPSPAFRWTADGTAQLEVNRAYCDLFGYSSQEEVRAACASRDLFVDADQCQRLVATLRAEGTVCGLPVALKRRTGEVVVATLSATAYLDSGYIEGTFVPLGGLHLA